VSLNDLASENRSGLVGMFSNFNIILFEELFREFISLSLSSIVILLSLFLLILTCFCFKSLF